MVDNYSLNFFKTIGINHDVNTLSLKPVVGDYGFNFLKKIKTVVTSYDFGGLIIKY